MKTWLNVIAKHLTNAGGNLDHWVIATIIAMFVSLGTASLIHGVEQHDSRIEHQREAFLIMQKQLNDRLLAVEKSQHPATMKRYTSDDAARDRQSVEHELRLIHERLDKLEKR